jgi:hypothetical protein
MTTARIKERMGRLYVGAWVMAAAAWGAVITGTWIVYPWYRVNLSTVGESAYAGCADLILPGHTCSPRDVLKSNMSGTRTPPDRQLEEDRSDGLIPNGET